MLVRVEIQKFGIIVHFPSIECGYLSLSFISISNYFKGENTKMQALMYVFESRYIPGPSIDLSYLLWGSHALHYGWVPAV
jgi:hypothetical protein